jgi:hypothetical protein
MTKRETSFSTRCWKSYMFFVYALIQTLPVRGFGGAEQRGLHTSMPSDGFMCSLQGKFLTVVDSVKI